MKSICRVAMNRLRALASASVFDEECTENSMQSTMASLWRFACA